MPITPKVETAQAIIVLSMNKPANAIAAPPTVMPAYTVLLFLCGALLSSCADLAEVAIRSSVSQFSALSFNTTFAKS